MCSLLLPLILLSLGLAASSNPVLSRRVEHERRTYVPPGWTISRKYDGSNTIPLRFALAQLNMENLEGYLYDVSHPSSPNYGKHWSAGKVASTFAPSRQSVDAVRGWLLESGIHPHRIKLSASRGWLEFRASVREAERLLHTNYNVYAHETGSEHVACESYDLPEHLGPHVDFVTPTVHFDAKLSRRSGSGQSPGSVGRLDSSTGPKTSGVVLDLDQLGDCDTHIVPLCLRALYGLWYDPVAAERNSYGVVEYTPVAYRQEDLNMFAMNFSSDLYGVSPVMVSIDGGVLSGVDNITINGEADLDLEYSMSLVTAKQNITLYQVGDVVEGASLNNFLDAIDGSYCTFEGGDDPLQDGIYPDPTPGGYNGTGACGTVKPANVISTSYGYNEADLTVAYATRQCNEYAKLGLMGVTILYSSGDTGVAGKGNLCLTPNGNQTANGTIFNPGFPGTCPYVTAVGATQLSPGKTITDGEDACEENIYSGGGFSNYFAIPNYQQDAVSSYLKNYPPPYPSSIWNSTGTSRGFPDISANGANYVVAVDGNFTLAYGTSASSPVMGAILTMVNDARIARNKGPIGFINPLIYSANFSNGFNDIANGTNPGCGTLGFNATKGWDPVTGLGTPNFSKLLAKWIDLP